MSGILAMARQFFDDDEWVYHELPERHALALGFQGKAGAWECFAEAREEQDQFLFYSRLSTNAPEESRPPLAEFLTRANYGLPIGNFEMDFSDGEIRYKTSLDVEGDRLTPQLVKMLVYANVATMDRYYAGIMQVMYGGAEPEAAIRAIEG